MGAGQFTSAFRRAMRHIPLASAIFATIGNPSGTAATARAMAVSIMRRIFLPAMIPATAIKITMARVTHTSFWPS